MSPEIFLDSIIPQVLELLAYISLGILAGVLLEASGCFRAVERFARPILVWAKMPSDCVGAFATAFVSAKASHGMLVSARKAGRLTQPEMILGALASTLPTAVNRLKFFAPMMVSVLGLAGLGYVLFVVSVSVTVFIVAVLASRYVWGRDLEQEAVEPSREKRERPGFRGLLHTVWGRWRTIAPRVCLVALPVYLVVEWAGRAGVFKHAESLIPEAARPVFSPESLTIIVAQLSRTSAAVSSAKSLLDSGGISPTSLFFTLVAGYTLAIPIKIIRRSLPATISIYPARAGLWIVGCNHGIRFLCGLVLVSAFVLYERA